MSNIITWLPELAIAALIIDTAMGLTTDPSPKQNVGSHRYGSKVVPTNPVAIVIQHISNTLKPFGIL